MTLITNRNDDHQEIDRLCDEIRMETIRENAAKSTWNRFEQVARKNLMNKKNVWNCENRLDVLDAIEFLKLNVPENENAPCAIRIRQLSESLECNLSTNSTGFFLKNSDITIELGCIDEKITSCKIGFWDDPLFDAVEAMNILQNGEFAQFRSCIFDILSILPSNVSQNDRVACKNALRALEQLLIKEAHDSSFSAINTTKFGFFCPRTPLRSGRIYYIVDPLDIKNSEQNGKYHADMRDLNGFPYLEFSFVANEKATIQLPEFHQSGEWRTFVEANVCVRLKFSQPILVSHKTERRLEKYLAKPSLTQKKVNQYRFLAGESKKTNLKIRTNLPDEYIDHEYEIDEESLKSESDSILVEIYIKDLKKLNEIVNIIRDEHMHNKLWQSILIMHENKAKRSQRVMIRSILTRRSFEFVFTTKHGLVNAKVLQMQDCQWIVRSFVASTGQSVSTEIDEKMTKMLQKTWNIPLSLSICINQADCLLQFSPIIDSLTTTATTTNNSEDVNSESIEEQIGAAWFSTKKIENIVKEDEIEKDESESDLEKKDVKIEEKKLKIAPKIGGYQRQDDTELRCGLLSMLGEVDEFFKTPPPTKLARRSSATGGELRTKRIDSTTTVFSDLEKIRMLAEADMDDDNTKTGVANNNSMMMMMRNNGIPPSQMSQQPPTHPLQSSMNHNYHQQLQHMNHHPQYPLHPHQMGSMTPMTPHHHMVSPGNGMSPLETARMQMKQSMGAAQAVALASHTPSSGAPTPMGKEMFDFPNDDYMGSPLSSSPSSQHGSGGGGGGGGGSGGSTRGAPKTRRQRARKPGANMGDRMVPSSAASPSTTPTGSTRGRRGRGGGVAGSATTARKISAATMKNEMDRPTLQRSFSDYPQFSNEHMNSPISNKTPPGFNNLAAPTMPPTMATNGFDDSDDECDPPPPPKMLRTLSSSSSSSSPLTTTLPLQSPTNLPVTPSPLAMPQKPWNEHQQQNQQQQDVKPETSVLNQMLSSAPSHLPPPPALPQKRKGLGLEAAISKIKGQQQQMNQLNQNQNQLTPTILSRASTLSDIFDDGMSPPEKKPTPAQLETIKSTVASTSSDVKDVLDVGKITVSMEPKIMLKIPKVSRNSPSIIDQQKTKLPSSSSGMPKLEKQEKKKKEKIEKLLQQQSQPAKKRKHESSSSSSSSMTTTTTSATTTTMTTKREKEIREPKEKKPKKEKDLNPINNILPTLSLKNFRIPKKETTDENTKDEGAASLGTSSTPVTSSQRKEPTTPSETTPHFRTEQHFFRDVPTTNKKKKSSTNIIGGLQLPGYPGPPMGPSSSSSGRRKSGNPPSASMQRGSYGGTSGLGRGGGLPGSVGYYQQQQQQQQQPPPQQQQQVASYSQGVPPGMGPPAAGPPREHYQTNWGRQHREYHLGHQASALASSSSAAAATTAPSSSSTKQERERERGGEEAAPESPEETLRIADE